MNAGKVVALGVIALGAAYVLGYNPLGLFSQLEQALTPLEQKLREAAGNLGERFEEWQLGEPQRSGAGGYSLTAGAATSAAGIAVGAGAALATVALVAGIAGGVAILVWGIVKRGWFRGGYEAIFVNPARDELIDVSATLPFHAVDFPGSGWRVWPPIRKISMDGRDVADLEGSGIPRSDWSQLRYESMLKLFTSAGVDGNETGSVIGQLYAADQPDEFEAAATRYIETLKAAARRQGLEVA